MKIFSCHYENLSYFCSLKSKDSTQLNGGTVAQLVEQRTENPRVTGSIPVGTTSFLETQCIVSLFFSSHTWIDKKKRLPKEALFEFITVCLY